jgi:arginase family enzyme
MTKGTDGALKGLEIALVRIHFDGGVSNRPGTHHGPRKIRNQSTIMRGLHRFDWKHIGADSYRAELAVTEQLQHSAQQANCEYPSPDLDSSGEKFFESFPGKLN